MLHRLYRNNNSDDGNLWLVNQEEGYDVQPINISYLLGKKVE